MAGIDKRRVLVDDGVVAGYRKLIGWALDHPKSMVMLAVTSFVLALAMPALGPSLGVAPAGTCTWMSVFSSDSPRVFSRPSNCTPNSPSDA